MTTFTLGMPAELRRNLRQALPSHGGPPEILITPRDSEHRKCAGYKADEYEVQAHYTFIGGKALVDLEEAFKAIPGTCMTTRVVVTVTDAGEPHSSSFTNPDWPPPLRTRRRNLRPQVIALMKDPTPAWQRAARQAQNETDAATVAAGREN